MHVGDLAWGTFHQWPSAHDAVRLWTDGSGRTQALTMFTGHGVCDLVVRPGDAGIEAATHALGWIEAEHAAVATGGEAAELRIGRRLHAVEVVDLLERRGFVRCEAGVPAMARSITGHLSKRSPTPTGYEIRALRADDIASRTDTFAAAFPGSFQRVEAYRALRSCPLYVPDLDVVAVTSSNDVVAFATLWLDRPNRVVQIEPTGCHPDHRRLGLTRAVILRALDRSLELGATDALVRHVSTNTAARALYESCGFSTASERTGFVRNRPPRSTAHATPARRQ